MRAFLVNQSWACFPPSNYNGSEQWINETDINTEKCFYFYYKQMGFAIEMPFFNSFSSSFQKL